MEIVSEAGLTGAKPASTPMEPNHKLAKSASPFVHFPDHYHRLIRKLIYVTLTRCFVTEYFISLGGSPVA